MTAHPHAENMRLYAEDAAETDKPWERWEYLDNFSGWTVHSSHPVWNRAIKYRRKPKPLECWVAEYESGFRQAHFAKPDSVTESVDNRLIRIIYMREVTE